MEMEMTKKQKRLTVNGFLSLIPAALNHSVSQIKVFLAVVCVVLYALMPNSALMASPIQYDTIQYFIKLSPKGLFKA